MFNPVSSVRQTIKKYTTSTAPLTPEEITTHKRNMLSTVNRALDQFNKQLDASQIPMKSTADLERLVKLNLLLMGEPTDTVGNPINQSEETVTAPAITLNPDDPDVQSIFAKMYTQMNKTNDTEVTR